MRFLSELFRAINRTFPQSVTMLSQILSQTIPGGQNAKTGCDSVLPNPALRRAQEDCFAGLKGRTLSGDCGAVGSSVLVGRLPQRNGHMERLTDNLI